jgi:hypothetical protein
LIVAVLAAVVMAIVFAEAKAGKTGLAAIVIYGNSRLGMPVHG